MSKDSRHKTTQRELMELRCRELRFESLEVRHLLSGAHDPQLVEAIRSAVSSSNNQGLSAWSDRLTNASLLGRSPPPCWAPSWGRNTAPGLN